MSGQVRLSIAAWMATILGSMVLIPVFSGSFLLTGAFVCAVVTVTGIGLQYLRAARPLVPLVQLLVLVEMLALAFEQSTLRWGLLPWRETAIAYHEQLADATNTINRFSAPLPPEPCLTVFAVSVVGVMGLVIHLIALAVRQAAWAGLLLLVMYTVPAATVHGVLSAGWFIPPATGYIVLLYAEGRCRLVTWGRRISGATELDRAEPVEASALAQAGRRIGLIVVAVSALLPTLVPALPENVFGNGLSGSGGSGLGTGVQSGNPFLDMGRNLRRGENVVALTYRGPAPAHLRLMTLDSFDGREWRASPRTGSRRLDGEMAPPPGLSKDLDSLPQDRYEIRASTSLRYRFLPVPYPARSVSIGGSWTYHPDTLDIESANDQTVAGRKYNVTAYNVSPTESELRAALPSGRVDDFTLVVPASTSPRVKQEAARVTAKANGNPYEQAVLLQDHFRKSGGFTYSLEQQNGTGRRALEEFLFEDRTGYCEQFATAMALMARTLGIPARVAVGYLQGQPGDDNEYTVRTHDMHAWPELYFSAIGWVRFEPTPAARTGAPPAWSEPTGSDTAGSPSSTPTAAPSSGASTPVDSRSGRPDRNLPDEGGAAPIGTQGWWSNTAVRAAAAGIGLLLLLSVPCLVRTLVRRRRFSRPPGPASVESLWAEVRDTARDCGLAWADTATPRQLGAWLRSEVGPEAQGAVVRLARGVESIRYAGRDGTDLDLREQAVAIRIALWKKAPRARRWRARLLPPSWRWYLDRGGTETSNLLDQFDLALARLRRSLLILRRDRRRA